MIPPPPPTQQQRGKEAHDEVAVCRAGRGAAQVVCLMEDPSPPSPNVVPLSCKLCPLASTDWKLLAAVSDCSLSHHLPYEDL